LADAGRHDEALTIYPTAIEIQRECWQRLPDAMCEPLSKMYYNYGRSLQRSGQFTAATDAALARREVWQGNGQRLFGVAVELAEVARSTPSDASNSETRKLHEEIIATLWASRNSGWHDQVQLADDERFAFLRQNQQFEQLIADSMHRPKSFESRSSGSHFVTNPTKN
jgi:hypothetical protein